MIVQPGLCPTCSKTTLLVFPRGGSYTSFLLQVKDEKTIWFIGCDFREEAFTVVTGNNRLYVYFNSSFFMTGTGFTITFQQIKQSECLQ